MNLSDETFNHFIMNTGIKPLHATLLAENFLQGILILNR
jgi:hypothetical protein